MRSAVMRAVKSRDTKPENSGSDASEAVTTRCAFEGRDNQLLPLGRIGNGEFIASADVAMVTSEELLVADGAMGEKFGVGITSGAAPGIVTPLFCSGAAPMPLGT